MRRGVLAVLFAGCTWPAPTIEGTHVIVAADPGLEMCGGTLAHMDAFVAVAAEAFGLAPPVGDDRFTLYWMVDDLDSRTHCGPNLGCAFRDSVWMSVMPLNHELVHSLSFAFGLPTGFFTEGLAVAYEGPDGEPDATALRDILPLVTRQSRELGKLVHGYPTAGAFVAYLVEQHGISAVLEMYAEIGFRAGEEAIDRAFRGAFGVALADSVEDFDAHALACPKHAYSAKLLECAAPEISWDGDSASLHRSLGCEQDDVIGPYDGTLAVALYTLEVPAGGEYEVSVIGDVDWRAEGTQNAVQLVRCGGCELPTRVDVAAGLSVKFALPAGRYAVRLSGPADEPTSIGVRVAAVPAL